MAVNDPIDAAKIRTAVLQLSETVGDTQSLPVVKDKLRAIQSQLTSAVQILQLIQDKLTTLVG